MENKHKDLLYTIDSSNFICEHEYDSQNYEKHFR